MRHLIQVTGMTCGHCLNAVTKAIEVLDPAAQAVIDLGTGKVTIDSLLDPARFEEAIRAEGYVVNRIP